MCSLRRFETSYQSASQANCFTGEASAIYDPCGNLISLVAQTTGAEVWARAVDKNSNQVIGFYDPYAIEMPYIGDGTVLPPYEEPIVSPIAFTIGKGGFNVKDHIASNTNLTIWIGDNGANVTIYDDDDCGDEICGWAAACDQTLSPWHEYCNCVANCFATNGDNTSTKRNHDNVEKWKDWKQLESDMKKDHLTTLIGYVGAGYAAGLSLFAIIAQAIKEGVSGIKAILSYGGLAALAAGVGSAVLVYIHYRGCLKHYKEWIDESLLSMEGYATVEERIVSYQKLVSDCREKCAKHAPTV